MLPEALTSFQEVPGALPGKWAPVRFQVVGETDIWRASVADVAVVVLSRFCTAQTMNIMVRGGAGVLYQDRENWVEFKS